MSIRFIAHHLRVAQAREPACHALRTPALYALIVHYVAAVYRGWRSWDGREGITVGAACEGTCNVLLQAEDWRFKDTFAGVGGQSTQA